LKIRAIKRLLKGYLEYCSKYNTYTILELKNIVDEYYDKYYVLNPKPPKEVFEILKNMDIGCDEKEWPFIEQVRSKTGYYDKNKNGGD